MVPDIRKLTHGNQPLDSVRLMFLDVNRSGNLCFLISLIKNLPSLQEMQVQSLGQEDPLEKGLFTHYSNPACGIPWTDLDTTERLRLEHIYSQFFATTPTRKCFLMNLQSQWSVCGLCSQQQLVFTSMKPLLTLPHSHLPLVLSPSLHQKGRLLRIKSGVYLSLHHQGGHHMVRAH